MKENATAGIEREIVTEGIMARVAATEKVIGMAEMEEKEHVVVNVLVIVELVALAAVIITEREGKSMHYFAAL